MPDLFAWDSLTPRQEEVTKGIALGLTNQEIADVLGFSIKTYDTHRHNILKLSGLRNNVELTRLALRDGFISLAEASEYDGPTRRQILADYSARRVQATGNAGDGGSTDPQGSPSEGAGSC